MRPLSDLVPKPLVTLLGRPLIEYPLEGLRRLRPIPDISVLVGAHGEQAFQRWRAAYHPDDPGLRVVVPEASRPWPEGVVADLQAHTATLPADAELLILAADNVFDFDLSGLQSARRRCGGAPVIGVWEAPEPWAVGGLGQVELGTDGRLLRFVEKPAATVSQVVSTGCYAATAGPLAEALEAFLAGAGRAGALGRFWAWLAARRPVHGERLDGWWMDVAKPADLESAARWLIERPAILRPAEPEPRP
jgi:glucose-1-phosphate thymidylyltransferase